MIASTVRVVLPTHLRTLARADREVAVGVSAEVTQRSVLDALEARYPMLRGTIREHASGRRRPFVRFFSCEADVSNDAPDAALPEPVAAGAEPFLIVGSIAGG
jgi:molybdopterin converting factor small subunit